MHRRKKPLHLSKEQFRAMLIAASADELDWQRHGEAPIRLAATKIEDTLQVRTDLSKYPFGISVFGLDAATAKNVTHPHRPKEWGKTQDENLAAFYRAGRDICNIEIVPLVVFIKAIAWRPPDASSDQILLQTEALFKTTNIGNESILISATAVDGRTIRGELQISRDGCHVTSKGEFEFTTNVIDNPDLNNTTDFLGGGFFEGWLDTWAARSTRGELETPSTAFALFPDSDHSHSRD